MLSALSYSTVDVDTLCTERKQGEERSTRPIATSLQVTAEHDSNHVAPRAALPSTAPSYHASRLFSGEAGLLVGLSQL